MYFSADTETDLKGTAQQIGVIKTKMKNKVQNTTKISSTSKTVSECSSSSSLQTVVELKPHSVDKNITASSSLIDLCHIIDNEEEVSVKETRLVNDMVKNTPPQKQDVRNSNSNQYQSRRDKHPRQHRIKVRSPKRCPPILENKIIESMKRDIGTSAIDWEELEVSASTHSDLMPNVIENSKSEDKTSNHSLEDMCRICHGGDRLTAELGRLISACSCRGTVGRVHVKCLERWLTESGKSRCELCGTRYVTQRVHRYGVPRALIMWILSYNAKQVRSYKSFLKILTL